MQAVISRAPFPLDVSSLATLLRVLPARLTLDHCIFTPLVCRLEEYCFKGQRRETREQARQAAVKWVLSIISAGLAASTDGRARQEGPGVIADAGIQIVQKVICPLLSPDAGFRLAVEQVDFLKPLIALESWGTPYHDRKASVLLASG